MTLFILLMLWPAALCAPYEGVQTYYPSGNFKEDSPQSFHDISKLNQMMQEPIHHGTHHSNHYSHSYSSHGSYYNNLPMASSSDHSSLPHSSSNKGTSSQGELSETALEQVQLKSPHALEHHHHNQYFYQHTQQAPGHTSTKQGVTHQQSHGRISSEQLENERQPEQLTIPGQWTQSELLEEPGLSRTPSQKTQIKETLDEKLDEVLAQQLGSSHIRGQHEDLTQHAMQQHKDGEIPSLLQETDDQLDISPHQKFDHIGQTHHVSHEERLPLEHENEVHGATITKTAHKVAISQGHSLHPTNHPTAPVDFQEIPNGNQLHPTIQQALDNIMKDLEEHPDRKEHPPSSTHHHKTLHHITHITHVTKHAQPIQTVKTLKIQKNNSISTSNIHGTAKDDINLSQLIDELHQLEQSPSHHNVTWCEERIKEFLRTLRRKQLQGVTIDQKVTEETLHNILTHDETIQKTVHTSLDQNEGIHEEPFVRKTVKELGHNEPTKRPSYWLEGENNSNQVDISSEFQESKHHTMTPKKEHNPETLSGQETGILTAQTEEPEIYTGVPTQDHVPELTILSHMKSEHETPHQEEHTELETEEEIVNPYPPPFVTNNNVPEGFETNQDQLDTKLPVLLPENREPTHHSQEMEEFQSSTGQELLTEKKEEQFGKSEISPPMEEDDVKSSEDLMSTGDTHGIANNDQIQTIPIEAVLGYPKEETDFQQQRKHTAQQAEQGQGNGSGLGYQSSETSEYKTNHHHSLESVDASNLDLTGPKDREFYNTPDMRGILNNESTNQSHIDSISLQEGEVTSPPDSVLETLDYSTEQEKGEEPKEISAHQTDQRAEEHLSHHGRDEQVSIASLSNGNQQFVPNSVDSFETEGVRGTDIFHSSSESHIQHHTGTNHHVHNQNVHGHNSVTSHEQTEQSEESTSFPTVHDLHTQQINYETLIEELVQLESLPGHQAIDKCEEKIREFLEVLRIQQERGFGRNQQELEKLHKTLIEQAQNHSHELNEHPSSLEVSSTSSPRSFWSKVGKKIRKTYQKAKEKAHAAISNALE